MGVKSYFSGWFSKYIVYKNSFWKKKPILYQERIFNSLLKKSKKTKFGEDHGFVEIKNYSDWKKRVPVKDYEGLSKYINRIINGEENVLWPKNPIYFCKTSGTTSGVKYIPITTDSMPYHLKAARDAILSYINETGNTSIVNGKMIFLQGSPKLSKTGKILTGRLSGIVAHHIPFYLQKNRLPSFETNLIPDWDKKVDAIVKETINEKMTLISGIPPWVQMYFEKVISISGKNIGSTFPFFKLFIYGGVNFEPYKKTFESLIGRNLDGVELYPSSEGFIAYQDSQKEPGMLLCVNHGIFYEFIVSDDFFNENPERICLKDVELGVNYVIILNTNAGLFGYNLGDTVKFVNLNPYKIVVTGRIKHFTSAFGEHVIAEEVEKSLNLTINNLPCEVNEFHVSPVINPKIGLPYHEWLIEFEKEPENIGEFEKMLDENLQVLNSYYKDLIVGKVLTRLKIVRIQKFGFRKYMKSIGKLGGQNKTPRLANDRKIADLLKNINN